MANKENEEKYCKKCLGTSADSGTYNNKVIIQMPDNWETKRPSRLFAIDSCMVPEIALLWRLNIRTIECCCGHGITDGYIAVDESDVRKMERLGYKHHPDKPNRIDLFLPKDA